MHYKDMPRSSSFRGEPSRVRTRDRTAPLTLRSATKRSR
jgi:hypothetical protein